MNQAVLEIGIAEATKRYLQNQWRLDISAFKMTKNRAWVHLARRILESPSAAIPGKSPTDRGVVKRGLQI